MIVHDIDSISPEFRGASPNENWSICGDTCEQNHECDVSRSLEKGRQKLKIRVD